MEYQFLIVDAIQHDTSNSNEPLQIPSGPITRARAKRIKEALNGLVQEVLKKQMAFGSTNENEDSMDVINLIWAEDGPKDHILGLEVSNKRVWTKCYT